MKKAPKSIQKGKYGIFQGSLVRNSGQEKVNDTLLTEDYNEEDLTITKIGKNNQNNNDYIELSSGEITRKKVKIKGPIIFRLTIYLIIALIIVTVLLFIILG
ncbi:hypothetical protein [Spiroplasma alleghenense]|uniref:Uncharacterized protein n=1 Tax=Spiroplasma alleghenense TaxID=216931 RepID=A0A345Z452_9MOLU|nr:hypothetical protein [Spiroplasma alleghenense]AXK51381.1 hypothetical protein SALLE_v1c07110 [Spiroplasma alleghenense]